MYDSNEHNLMTWIGRWQFAHKTTKTPQLGFAREYQQTGISATCTFLCALCIISHSTIHCQSGDNNEDQVSLQVHAQTDIVHCRHRVSVILGRLSTINRVAKKTGAYLPKTFLLLMLLRLYVVIIDVDELLLMQ
jgi:hypothetical protein